MVNPYERLLPWFQTSGPMEPLSASAAARRWSPRGGVGSAHRADLPFHRPHESFRIVRSSRLDDDTRLARATNVREGIPTNDHQIGKLSHLDRSKPIAEPDGAC